MNSIPFRAGARNDDDSRWPPIPSAVNDSSGDTATRKELR